MLARSVRNPLIISVGTGFVLVSGTAAMAVTDTPSPTAAQSPSTPPRTSPGTPKPTSSSSGTPATPTLSLKFTRLSTAAVHAGTAVKFNAHVASDKATSKNVRLSLSASDASVKAQCTLSVSLCKLGDVSDGEDQDITFTVTVDSDMKSGTVTLKGEAFGSDNVDSGIKSYAIKVTKTPTKSPTPSKTSSGNSGSGKSGSSGSSGSSGGGSSTSNLPSGLGGSGSDTTPSVAPSNDPAVLPSIAPTPSTAPNTVVQNTGNAQQMRGTAEAADELTFDKLASTQAAWLAALLVAFSLLLTQVRLGRANARTPKAKGAHRRPRRPGGAH